MIRRVALATLCLLISAPLGGCGSDGGGNSAPAPAIKVMSYNILCSFCDRRNYDPWEERLAYFGDIFERYDPDLIGVQELTPLGNEVAQVLAEAPGRGAIYYAPQGATPYPDAMILYRESRFSVIEHGEYWLSPTPEVPLSTGFSPPQLPRLVVWARLRDLATDREIFFATTHFDNNSPSQQLSAPLVLQRTAPFVSSEPVIVVGDFNSRPNSTAYGLLTGDPRSGFTFDNAFDLTPSYRVVTNQTPAPEYDPDERIDHIFLAGADWTVSDWAVDLTVYGTRQRYPSDHFAIAATVTY